MRLVGAFTAAVSAAALIFACEFVLEGFLGGVPLSPSIFLIGIALNLVVGVPATLLGGIPIWIAFRTRRIRSPRAYAIAGAALSLITYLILVALGMGRPSDRPMTFFENLGRFFHVPRIIAAMIAGALGSLVFWLIAVKRSLRTVPSSAPMS